mmetsp:Transcript_2063/g.7484  ORF Transcript_2063/g.7484 Transcript_2063/m.7484 type:complete len:216 (-) Transcript_2063:324-971(-)
MESKYRFGTAFQVLRRRCTGPRLRPAAISRRVLKLLMRWACSATATNVLMTATLRLRRGSFTISVATHRLTVLKRWMSSWICVHARLEAGVRQSTASMERKILNSSVARCSARASGLRESSAVRDGAVLRSGAMWELRCTALTDCRRGRTVPTVVVLVAHSANCSSIVRFSPSDVGSGSPLISFSMPSMRAGLSQKSRAKCHLTHLVTKYLTRSS